MVVFTALASASAGALCAQGARSPADAVTTSTPRTAYLATARVDFAVVSDTTRGVGLFAVPSLATVQGDSIVPQGIWLDPDSVQAWLEKAPVYLSPAVTVGDNLPPVIWTPRLGDPVRGYFSVGRKSATTIAAWEHYVTFNGTEALWRSQVTGKELNQLLMLMFQASTQSRLDKRIVAGPNGTLALRPFDCADLVPLVPVTLEHVSLHHPAPGKKGQVYATYIIGPDGRAEPGSFRVLVATTEVFALAAEQAIMEARFTPAQYCGTAVRQSVQQRITFR